MYEKTLKIANYFFYIRMFAEYINMLIAQFDN